MNRKPAPFPSREEILEWLRLNPGAGAKRDIAKAFGIRGADKIELKRILREMQDEGLIERRGGLPRLWPGITDAGKAALGAALPCGQCRRGLLRRPSGAGLP